MENKGGKVMDAISLFLPLVILVGFMIVGFQNYAYNSKERVHVFSDADRTGTSFAFDDVTVDIAPRGGDSGSWTSGAIALDEGSRDYLYHKAVGIIYDITITNNSSDTIPYWELSVYIPEKMFINNTWNGDIELHQNVAAGNEKVQTVNLNEYSKYDFEIEAYITPSGPMVAMYNGDYFNYYPNKYVNEMPLGPKPSEENKESNTKIGLITYIPEKNIDYVTNFTQGEIRYYLEASLFDNPLFWVLCILTVVWISSTIAMFIVKRNMKQFEERKKRDQAIIEQTMQTFVNFIEAKDPSTMGHSVRVAKYTKMIAESMGFSEDECNQVYYIALMHDCGKIYIPDEILSKPGRLDDDEFDVMKMHTVYGKDILRDFTAIEKIGVGALSHHERYDGKGYPNGIAGDEIPLIARIICVSDAFDAMNSKRCYRDNLSEDIILNELKKNKGKQFDPKVVDCLLALISRGVISIKGKEER
ncbi:MAG: HD-GYP domain-containing protein [Ruminiclostridium sp.]|nr:HD-GYP domain-containing protein [Ruminiclostridium sp.]